MEIMKTKLLILSAIIPALIAIVNLANYDSTAGTPLKRGFKVIDYMMKPINLSRSGFYVGFPNGKPSQFVSYLFSSMGSAEWPYSEAIAEKDPILREQSEAIRAPLIPKNVAFVSRTPDLSQETQVVLKFDDARNIVILEGYENPKEKSILKKEIKLIKVQPIEFAEMIFWSNAELGMSIQSF